MRYDPRAGCYIGTFWSRGGSFDRGSTDTVRLIDIAGEADSDFSVSPFLKMENGIATDVILMVAN